MTTESEALLAWPFRMPVLRVFLLPFVQNRKRDRLLLILLACIMSTAGFLMQGNGSYDSDGWFLLATGREIVEHGIPYANPWSFFHPIGRLSSSSGCTMSCSTVRMPWLDTPARYSIRLS